jgi:hypothetical protein
MDNREYKLQAEHYRRIRNWLIWLIVICIALVVVCAIFLQKWQEERIIRIVSETLAESYQQDANHYQQLYYDCLNQTETAEYP